MTRKALILLNLHAYMYMLLEYVLYFCVNYFQTWKKIKTQIFQDLSEFMNNLFDFFQGQNMS